MKTDSPRVPEQRTLAAAALTVHSLSLLQNATSEALNLVKRGEDERADAYFASITSRLTSFKSIEQTTDVFDRLLESLEEPYASIVATTVMLLDLTIGGEDPQ